MGTLLSAKQFAILIESIEKFFLDITGELTAIDTLIPGFKLKDFRVERDDLITNEPCYYYRRSLLLRSLLSSQPDFFDDCTVARFSLFLDLFKA